MHEDWIQFWARLYPDHVAVLLPGGPVRYGQFDAQIGKVAARLAALGLQPGRCVAINQPDEYVHWQLVLALERLGLATVSVANLSPQHPILSVLKPDLLLTTAEGVDKTPVRSLAITPEWLAETAAMPEASRAPRQRQPGDTVRYFSSSGTTGTPKLMAVTRAQMDARIDQARVVMPGGLATRACTLLGMGTAGGYTWPLGYWSGGGSNVLNIAATGSVAQALRRTQPSQVVMSVLSLHELVRGPAASLPPIPTMEVFVVGSVVPRALQDEARRVLTPRFNVSYASTEASGIGISSAELLSTHDSTAAIIFPGTEVEAVDEADRPLPPGTTGVLRARNACVITGYLNEDLKGGARSAVRDGWFYSGDVGSVSADGVVVVEGRVNDVMNIGGNKYFPRALEDVALTCAGISDAAVFTVPDRLGVETPWIAVVRGAGHQPGELAGKLKAKWPSLTGLQVVAAQAIPRNEMGKIDRLKLRQGALASIRKE